MFESECVDRDHTIPVVLLKGKSRFVPRRYASSITLAGIVQVDFCRNTNSREVKNAITKALSASENIGGAQFLKCGQDNRLWLSKE